jgi:ubiquitin carboxyl-terminal hydrolase 4/11/15
MSNKFLGEINSTNPLGTKGNLACAYAELIREMWTGPDNYVSPHNLKKMIGKFAGQFSGYTQQDSQ